MENNNQNLFQDLNPEARAKALGEFAKSTGSEKVRRYYNDDEKSQMKDFVTDESTNLMDKKAEFAEISKTFRQGIKEYEGGIKDALVSLKRGYSENDETVYFIDDQYTGVMKVYDAKGEFLYQRTLRPEEKQRTILAVAN